MLMIDLFAGLGGASQAFRDRGWEVVTVDNDPRFNCTHTADITTWTWDGPRPNLVWASPPCTEFSRECMPWCRTGNVPSLALVQSALRVIHECDPDWWVLENVRGSIKYIAPLLGKPKQSHGPFFLWGQFPPFRCRVKFFKGRLSSQSRAERAMIPTVLSESLARAIESNLLMNLE